MDITNAIYGTVQLLFTGMENFFNTLSNISFLDISLIDFSIAVVISSIIFNIVFSYVKSRLNTSPKERGRS